MELTQYFFDEKTTLELIAEQKKLTRERIRQKINKQIQEYKNEILFYCTQNKINKKQFKICSKIIKNTTSLDWIKIKSNYKILSDFEIQKNQKIKQKIKRENIFKNIFIGIRTNLEEFEINLFDIEQYEKELIKNKIKFNNEYIKKRNIFSRMATNKNIVHINKNNFMYVDYKSTLHKIMIDEISNFFLKKHFKLGFWFMSTNDDCIVKKFNFQNGTSLHAFMKKYYCGKKMYFKNQPRIDFCDLQTLPLLLVKQLETWQIIKPIEDKKLWKKFKNSNYTKIQFYNILSSLKNKDLNYIYQNKKIYKKG